MTLLPQHFLETTEYEIDSTAKFVCQRVSFSVFDVFDGALGVVFSNGLGRRAGLLQALLPVYIPDEKKELLDLGNEG